MKHPFKCLILLGVIILLFVSCNSKKQKNDTGVFTTYYRTCGVHHISGNEHIGENVCVTWNTNLGSYKISYFDVVGNEQFILFKEKGFDNYNGQSHPVYYVVDYSEGAFGIVSGGKQYPNDDWILITNPCECGSPQKLPANCETLIRRQTDPDIDHMPDRIWINIRVCDK